MTDKQQELRALLEETIDEQVEKKVAKIHNENKELRATVNKLQDKVLTLVDERDAARNEAKDAEVLLEVVEIFKSRLDNIQEKPIRSEFVYNLLKLFFEPDFEESTYDCPIWLGAVVNFYSHKDIVIRLLKVLDIYVPNNIEKFRLPHEWTTEELDIVFDTMPKHIVCNSCTYADNLRFWQPHALDDVYDVCYNCMTYSEIPWQFLLRNPNLLNKKYLKKIGKMAYEEPYVSGWRYLFAIDKYQDMTEEQLKTIINEIGGAEANISKENSVSEFLLRHLDLIEDGILIDKIYKKYYDSYSFRYENRILKMPVEYLELWVKEKAKTDPRQAIEWIVTNTKKFTEEQKNNLLKLVMTEVLK